MTTMKQIINGEIYLIGLEQDNGEITGIAAKEDDSHVVSFTAPTYAEWYKQLRIEITGE